jgi:invasion protein IalB
MPIGRSGTELSLKWIVLAVGAALVIAFGIVVATQFGGSGFNKSTGETQRSADSSSGGTSTPGTTVPVRTETITYDSWTVTCRITGEPPPKRTCSGTLQLVDKSNGRVLFAWIFGKDNQGILQTVMQTPTGVQILNGVELKFSNAQARKIAYTICDPQHCEAATAVDGALMKDLLSNTEATVTILATDGRGINFNLSMKGIDKVIDSLSKS